MQELKDIKKNALKDKKANKKFLDKLKKVKKQHAVDNAFYDAHVEAFSCIDCLKCANCCKTTGPLFTDKDITRIAKHLKLKPGQFIEQYLRLDEENDYVLQKVPCTFLGTDNYCSIYDVRPKACAEFPHTDRSKQSQIFNLTLKNTEVCPAVNKVLDLVKKEF